MAKQGVDWDTRREVKSRWRAKDGIGAGDDAAVTGEVCVRGELGMMTRAGWEHLRAL